MTMISRPSFPFPPKLFQLHWANAPNDANGEDDQVTQCNNTKDTKPSWVLILEIFCLDLSNEEEQMVQN